MSGTATPTGAEPVGTLSASGSFTGKYRELPIASAYGTAILYGDFVKCVSGGTVDLSQITTALDTGTIGIFVGCRYTDPNTNQLVWKQHWSASTIASDAVAFVADDPFLLFKMQADGSLAATTLFNNISGIDTRGSVTDGRGACALQASSAAVTNSLPFRIVEFVEGPDSAVGDAYTDVIVAWLPGGHAYVTATGV